MTIARNRWRDSMGPGQITLSEIVRAVDVGKRAFPMAVGLVVVMIWNRHVGTGRAGAEEARRTAWCSILMTRTRPGGTATNEGLADAQGRGRPSMIAENASGAVAQTEAGTSRGRGGVIVTVTFVTELTGVKSPVLYVTVSCASHIQRLQMPDRLQFDSASFCHCAPKK